jgi:muramidase (phage lysozyme)
MRFASIGGSNAGSYAAAGKAVADSGAKMFKKQRETGPDYAGLSKVAMNTASNEKIAGMQAEAKLTNVAQKVYADQTQNAYKIKVFETKEDIKNSQRKAGGLAAIGKIAGAGFLAATDNTKGRERPKADYSAINSGFKKARDARMSTYDSEINALNSGSSTASTSTGGGTPGKVTTGNTASPSTASSGEGMTDGWSRMSRVIKTGEGTLGDKGYTTQFTGKQFTDLSRHPAQINSSNGLSSDAAGAYQFLSTTYNPAAKRLGITDFSPASQERVGKHLAQQRGMNTDTVFTDKAAFLKELDKIAPEWASMPTLSTGTSYYGQGGLTPDRAWQIYNGN